MSYEVDVKELRKAMIEKDFNTIEDLSVASGVNRNTLADVINGKSFPSSSVMVRVGNALGFNDFQMGKIFFRSKLAPDASGTS